MPQGQTDKDHNASIVVLGLAFFVLMIVWFRLRSLLVVPVFCVDAAIYSIGQYFGLSPLSTFDYAYVQQVLADKSLVKFISFHDFSLVQHNVGYLCRIPSAVFLCLLAVFIAYAAPEDNLVRRFSFRGGRYGERWTWLDRPLPDLIAMLPLPGKKKALGFLPKGKDFMLYQSEFWRTSITGAYFDQYRNESNWLPSATELDVAMQAGVSKVSSEETPRILEQHLIKQLSTPWEGIRKAPVQAQAIAALVVVNRQRNLKKVAALAGELALCAIPHQAVNFERMAQVIKPILTDKNVEKLDLIGGKHAFLHTAMIAIYGSGGPFREWGGARAGILQPALFLWLKGVDRGLWYALQCVGRPKPFAESCAVLSHYKYERMLRRPEPTPYIKAAVNGFISTLKSMKIDDVADYHAQLMDRMI